MDKLKEIFHKIKTTEIKFKKPDFIEKKKKTSAKNISEETLLRKFRLQNLKNISWQDIKNFDIQRFYAHYSTTSC